LRVISATVSTDYSNGSEPVEALDYSIELEVEASKKKRVEHRKIVVPRELLSVELLSIEEKRKKRE
jgi:hypothetical protein